MRNALDQNGFKQVTNYPAPDDRVSNGERPNLIALLEGKNPDKTLWIITHTDIVPAGDLSKWETDPFIPVVKDGKIFGRGSEDNHQGTVSSIIMAGGPHSVSWLSNFLLRGVTIALSSPFSFNKGCQSIKFSDHARLIKLSPQYIKYLPSIFAATCRVPSIFVIIEPDLDQ